jgi:preprotein translocase subunit YajC
MINNLKKGDQVITRGGVIGRISGVKDNVVTLEIQEKVRIRVLKAYVEGKHTDAPPKADSKEPQAAPSETASPS